MNEKLLTCVTCGKKDLPSWKKWNGIAVCLVCGKAYCTGGEKFADDCFGQHMLDKEHKKKENLYWKSRRFKEYIDALEDEIKESRKTIERILKNNTGFADNIMNKRMVQEVLEREQAHVKKLLARTEKKLKLMPKGVEGGLNENNKGRIHEEV